MKKIGVVLFTFFISMSSWAGKVSIGSDKTFEDGSRMIMTSFEKLNLSSIKTAEYCISVSVDPDGNSKMFLLYINFKRSGFLHDEGDKLLLKLDNNEIIELTNEHVKTPYDYETQGLYILSTDNIKKLIENELVKIRIETISGYKDQDVKKFKSNFIKLYELLNHRLNESNSIYDGF